MNRFVVLFCVLLPICATTKVVGQTPAQDSLRTARREAENERLRTDWANLKKFSKMNAELPPPAANEDRVVFIGNSIIESWTPYFQTMFPGRQFIGRGISGQTTPQILVRFRQDVIALRPKAVVILAGTNDIAGNTGAATIEMIEDNLTSMVELAMSNGIRVILTSVLPAYAYKWNPGVEPAQIIIALNQWMRDYASKTGITYLDLHSPMSDERGAMKSEYSLDGVHPTEAGYRVMAPLMLQAIDAVIGK
ncbi:MAG TPA: SGNH/GDSL hydrolase family protein [Gemmatimonadaceae bacterium]|nr:SGNH/GDSL hydrolase family protein [Gemmatimonadaceae bacterium]